MGYVNQIFGIEGALAPFAVGVVARATILVAVAGLFSLLLVRASAAARHLVWASAIGGALLLPLLTAATPWTWEVLPRLQDAPTAAAMDVTPDVVATPAPPVAPTAPLTAETAPASTPVPNARLATFERSGVTARETSRRSVAQSTVTREALGATRTVPGLAGPVGLGVLLWVAVAALLLAHMLVGRLALASYARGAEAVDELYPLQIVASRASEIGAWRPVRLLRTSRVEMPLTWGVRRPVILLPEASREWSRERMRLVLEHELAHVWRFDALSHALGRIACALYWFNPVVWIAAARLQAEGERASDDWVLRRGARASEYAGHLLEMAAHLGRGAVPVGAVPFAQRSQFEGRVIAILEPSVDRRRLGGLGAIAMSGVVGGLVCLLTVVAPVAASIGHVDGAEAPAVTTAAAEQPAEAAEDQPNHAPEVATPEPTFEARTVEPLPDPSAQELVSESSTSESVSVPSTPESVAEPSSEERVSEPTTQEMDPRSVRALSRTLLNDESPEVRRMAAWALGEIESRAATPALSRALLTDSSAEVRRMAAWALGEIEDPASAEALGEALDDENAEVRSTALHALAELEVPEAVEPLMRALRDADPEVRRQAAWGLGEIESPEAVEALADALISDSDALVRRQAAWALGEIESEWAVPALSAAMEDIDAEVRMMAMWALGEIESEAAVPALVYALGDTEVEVRRKAAWALGEIESVAAVEALAEVVVLDSDAQVRRQAAWALGEIESEAAVPALVEALSDQDVEVRKMAAWALGEIEPTSSAIIELLEDPDPEVREVAVRALSGGKRGSSRIRERSDLDGQ